MKQLIGIALIAGLASAANAGTWAEVGDAGELISTAQHPTGSGGLTSITGHNGGFADMFCIYISDPSTFSATTSGTPGTLVDTQLFLFDSSGMGIQGNDDGSAALRATLVPFAGAAGEYYIALSGYDYDPVSAGGLIFPSSPFGPHYGPTGPGGGSALSGWAGGGGSGTYTIELVGADFCRVVPLPTGAGLGMASLLGIACVRRRKI